MIQLTRTLQSWNSNNFEQVFKAEAGALDASLLPLQHGLTQGSHALESDFSVVLLGASRPDKCLRIRAGIFYRSVVAGCNCADDPTPVDELTEYCEVQFDIDPVNAATTVSLLQK